MTRSSFMAGGLVDAGLLILRIGVGLMFITAHGLPKLMAGPEMWEKIGQAMSNVGITSGYMYWGLASGIAEALGGFLIATGLLFAPACIFLIINLFVASTTHFANGQGLGGASHAIELAIVFLGLMFIGPGRYSIDKWLFWK